jgi:hypothetical protein
MLHFIQTHMKEKTTNPKVALGVVGDFERVFFRFISRMGRNIRSQFDLMWIIYNQLSRTHNLAKQIIS